jgi:hypothetical protein
MDDKPVDNVTGGEVIDPEKGEPQDTNPEKEVSDTEVTETKETESDPKKETSEPSEEESLKGFNPEKLDPKLKAVYKQMQADYTKKTQEIAEVRRQAEAYKRFSPYLQKIMADEKLSQQVFNEKSPEPQEEQIPDDPKEYAEWVKNKTLADVQKMMQEEKQLNRYMEADQQDRSSAEKVDARLNSDPDFARQIAGIVNSNAQYQNREISAVEATKQAIKEFDSYMDRVLQQRNADLINKAKSSSTGVYRTSSPQGTTTSEALSVKEAWQQAEEELARQNIK